MLKFGLGILNYIKNCLDFHKNCLITLSTDFLPNFSVQHAELWQQLVRKDVCRHTR